MKSIITLIAAFKRYWIFAAIAVVAGLVMAFLPDWNFIPFGFLRLACALIGALFVRHMWLTTIGSWIDDGGFKTSWYKCSHNTRITVSVAAPLIIFIGVVLCFIG